MSVLPDPATVQQPAPPAIQGVQPAEHMIPKSRLDEVLESNKKLQERIDTVEKERQEQLEKQLSEQGKWKELAEQRANELAGLKPKADLVDEYETVLKEQLAAEVASLPEDYKDIIPDGLTTKDQLRWLAKNKAKFMKAEPYDIGAGKRGIKQEKNAELTAEEKEVARRFGMTDEEYAKAKNL